MNTDRIAEHLNSLASWTLAEYADCLAPATDSGTAFLTLVRDCVVRDWERLTETNDPDAGGGASEIAYGCVPTSSRDRWAAFVDLGAYYEDVTGLGDTIRSLNQAAHTALYTIATRLVYALVDKGKALDDDSEGDSNA